MILGEIDSLFSLLDRLGRVLKLRRSREEKPADSVASRFVKIFESHGVHRNQIPRFFGRGLTLQDVQNDESLLAKLDEPVLEDACNRFAVRREWLDGVDAQIHPHHDFYKHPKKFSDFIHTLRANNPEGELVGVLIAPNETKRQAPALLILQETIGVIGDKAIYRYHLCNNWGFNYWKARAYLTACIAIAWKSEAYVHGIHMPNQDIEQLSQGETLLGWQGEGIWALGHKTWDPEDMALRPEAFLKGIDPEQDNYGIKAGLTLWLELEGKGLMDTDIVAVRDNVRRSFEQELARYSTAAAGPIA